MIQEYQQHMVKSGASQVVLVVKNLPANVGRCKRHGFSPWVGKIPWRRKGQPTPVFLPGEVHGQRSLASYNPWSCKELDMIECMRARARTHTHDQGNIASKYSE